MVGFWYNQTIKSLLANGKITQEQYDILFVDKVACEIRDDKIMVDTTNGDPQFFKNKDERIIVFNNLSLFHKTLKQVIEHMKHDSICDLSHIHFPYFSYSEYLQGCDKAISFQDAVFHGKVTFFATDFTSEADFTNTQFISEAIFNLTEFRGKANFANAKFADKVNFNSSRFADKANFLNAEFNAEADFVGAKLNGVANFKTAKFSAKSNFDKAQFHAEAYFLGVQFHAEAYFLGAQFNANAEFAAVKFTSEANFEYAKFASVANFRATAFEKHLSMIGAGIDTLDLLGAKIDTADFLELNAKKETEQKPQFGAILQAKNFANKETARIIKASFDDKKNITESNKYHKLEQELYLDELKNPNTIEPNSSQTIVALRFNKYVSNFGTDWLRALLVLLMAGYAFMIGYILLGDAGFGWIEHSKDIFVCIKQDEDIKQFDMNYVWYSCAMLGAWFLIYASTFEMPTIEKYLKKPLWIGVVILIGVVVDGAWSLDTWDFSCYAVQVTNPISAFKDIELYKGIELYAAVVRIVIALLIYQLISAFRNNTRRA